MTAMEKLYQQAIKPLPVSVRLQLASLILHDISPIDSDTYSDEWTVEDMDEITAYSFSLAEMSFDEDESHD